MTDHEIVSSNHLRDKKTKTDKESGFIRALAVESLDVCVEKVP